MARLRRRRPRGRFGFYHRGRWHWRHRLRRRRYSRRGKFRYARRRSFDRRVKRRIFNPHPGSYVVRLPNPYNKLTLFFQGIVFIPEAQAFVKSTYTKTNLTVCHVASINVNLREFMLATMPLDAKSKIGALILILSTCRGANGQHKRRRTHGRTRRACQRQKDPAYHRVSGGAGLSW